MLRHIVLFKLNELGIEKKDELLNKLNDLKMDIFVNKEVGFDIVGSKRAYDVCLNIEFNDLAGLEEYDKFQPHLDLKVFLRDICSDISVIDYEI